MEVEAGRRWYQHRRGIDLLRFVRNHHEERSAVDATTAGGKGEVRTLVRHGVRLPVFKTGLLRPLEYLSVCKMPSQPFGHP